MNRPSVDLHGLRTPFARTGAPLALRLHLAADTVVPPCVVTAAVEWDVRQPCEVLDAHASIEVHVRAALLSGAQPTVLEETAVVTGHGDVIPRYPGDGAETLPLGGQLFPGAHGRLPCAIVLGAAHPTVRTPSLSLTHTVIARVLLVGHDPIEVRRPITLLAGRGQHLGIEHLPPYNRHEPSRMPPAVEVRTRHVRPGTLVTGTAWPGEGGPTHLSLRRSSLVHALVDPGSGPVARDDIIVAETTVEADGEGEVFALPLPADAAPTCVTRFGAVRWVVRAETTHAERRRRWRRAAPSSSVTEVELNVCAG